MTQPITATGTRGYLQWLKQDQPQLFTKVAPLIAAQVPGIFSSYDQTRIMNFVAGIDSGESAASDLQGLGQTLVPITLATVDTTVADSDFTGPDISDIADTTATDPSDASSILGIVGSVAGTTATDALSDFDAANSQALDAAAAGVQPPDVSTGSSLFSDLTSGSTGTTLLIAGGGLLLLALALGT